MNGWRAECQDCPPEADWAYGHLVKVHTEWPDSNQGIVKAYYWALRHRKECPGHRVTVTKFGRCTVPVTVDYMDPDIWWKLTGG